MRARTAAAFSIAVVIYVVIVVVLSSAHHLICQLHSSCILQETDRQRSSLFYFLFIAMTLSISLEGHSCAWGYNRLTYCPTYCSAVWRKDWRHVLERAPWSGVMQEEEQCKKAIECMLPLETKKGIKTQTFSACAWLPGSLIQCHFIEVVLSACEGPSLARET